MRPKLVDRGGGKRHQRRASPHHEEIARAGPRSRLVRHRSATPLPSASPTFLPRAEATQRLRSSLLSSAAAGQQRERGSGKCFRPGALPVFLRSMLEPEQCSNQTPLLPQRLPSLHQACIPTPYTYTLGVPSHITGPLPPPLPDGRGGGAARTCEAANKPALGEMSGEPPPPPLVGGGRARDMAAATYSNVKK